MLSLVWNRGEYWLPRARRVVVSIRSQVSNKQFKTTKRFVIKTAILTSLVVVGLFAYAHYADHALNSRNTLENQTSKSQLPAASANRCAVSRIQTNTLFSACPSFALFYGAKASGIANTDKFNIYAGPPIANNEVQYYVNSADNLSVIDGKLVLSARVQPTNGYAYTSTRLDTQGKEDFLYGKLIVRASLPSSIGTWPAIWMLPSQPKYVNAAPLASNNRDLNDGEIDIAESVGVEPHVVYGVAHSLMYPENGPDRSYYNTITIPDNDTVQHDYEVDWTPTRLTFLIDGQAYYSYSKQPNADWRSWPFDQPFYLIINLALGGNWAGSDTKDFPGDGIDKPALPAHMAIEAIKYYPYVGPK